MDFIKKLLKRPVAPAQPATPITPSLAGISYVMAYRILPMYAFDTRHDLKMWSVAKACGPYFYMLTMGMAFEQRPEDCDKDEGRRFQWHSGQLKDGRTYFLMEYPLTPEHAAVLTEEDFLKADQPGRCMLPPYFSAMVGKLDEAGEKFSDVRYFVLGKSPMPGCTTLREVTTTANMNRGVGPEAKLENFLEAIETA